MRTFRLLTLLAALPAFADFNAELDKANRLLFDQKYGDAAKALEAAAKVSGNSRDVVVRIYELQGIVYGQLGQANKSREAFQSMLSLDPKRALNGKYSQKVLSAYAAAKDWSENNPALEFKSAKAALDAKNRVMQLAAKVRGDAMKLTRKVRFHLKADDGNWVVQDSEIQGAYAAANTDAAGVEWWAELLGENDRVLVWLGNDGETVREGTAKDKAPAKPEPVKKEEVVAASDAPKAEAKVEPKPAPVEEKKPEVKEEVRADSGGGSGPLRPAGYVMIGVGVAALGVGTYFGVQASLDRSRINSAAQNSQGLVTGLTQRDAFALDKQASSNALIANVLFISGGAVALTGGVLWLVGGLSSSSSDSASLGVSPAPGGLVVSGGF